MFFLRRQNAEEKQAERQATNKLLMTLKQQQQLQLNQTKSLLNIPGTNTNTITNTNGLDLSSFNSLSSAVSSIASGQLETAIGGDTENSSIGGDDEINPLNKLIMMEKVFAVAAAANSTASISANATVNEKQHIST